MWRAWESDHHMAGPWNSIKYPNYQPPPLNPMPGFERPVATPRFDSGTRQSDNQLFSTPLASPPRNSRGTFSPQPLELAHADSTYERRHPPVAAQCGVGLVLEPAPTGFVVKETLDSGPAERAGIREGDVLITVDGTNVVGMQSVAHLMAGPPNSMVACQFWEKGTDQLQVYNLTREDRVASLSAALDAAKTDTAAAKAEVDRFATLAQDHLRETQHLHSENVELRQAADRANALAIENQQLRDGMDQLQREPHDLRLYVDQLLAENNDLKQRTQAYELESSQYAGHCESLTNQVAALRADLTEASTRVSAVNGELDRMRVAYQQLEFQAEQAKGRALEAEQLRRPLESERNGLRMSIQEFSEESARLRRQLDEAVKERDRLNSEVEKLRTKGCC